jgi:paraquat-inducible protein B
MAQRRYSYSARQQRRDEVQLSLFANLDKALENSLSDLPTTTLTLTADTLPDVQAGSVVLYRKFEVGEIITVRPAPMRLISKCISSRNIVRC